MKKKFIKGQALLIVLLSMAVVLTVVLSILARSITDVSITSRDEDSLRAFSAAEAGVEKALITGSAGSLTGAAGEANFSASITSLAEGSQEFSYPILLTSGDSVVVWFVAHDSDGNLTCSDKSCFAGSKMKICWGKSGTASDLDTTPAVQVSIFYVVTPGDYSSVMVARDAIDPNSSRRTSDNFSAPDTGTCTIGEETFVFQKTLDFATLGIPVGSYGVQNGLQFARLRIFYNSDISQNIGVSVDFAGARQLPSQGMIIESLGASGEANRRLNVFQSYGETPSIFDSAVFSPEGIVK